MKRVKLTLTVDPIKLLICKQKGINLSRLLDDAMDGILTQKLSQDLIKILRESNE